LFNKNSVEIEIDLIKDFEMIQRRAKILMQTVCHISGAAYLYDKNLIHEKYNEQGEKSDEPKKVKNFFILFYLIFCIKLKLKEFYGSLSTSRVWWMVCNA